MQHSPSSVRQLLIELANTPTGYIPMDIALLGASFQDADWLCFDPVMQHIAKAHQWAGKNLSCDLRLIKGGIIPNNSENLLVEFSAAHTLIPDPRIQRIGMHVVAKPIAQQAPVIRMLLSDWVSLSVESQSYAIAIFLEEHGVISVSPFFVTVDVSSSGRVKITNHLPMYHEPPPFAPHQKHRVIKQVDWLVYLLFCGFARLHNEEAGQDLIKPPHKAAGSPWGNENRAIQ